ncbi:MAG: response regulator transcription factor [Spirochaetales bacterium]|nr:response regulator transcription factor [Spirochaetales bacterium]
MKKILIIDDNIESKKHIAEYLEDEGSFQVDIKNKKQSLEQLEKQNLFDLVIVDILISQNNGWTICREIKKITDIPLVVVTSNHEDIYELYGYEIGIDEYIRKPFNPEILIARMNALLRRRNGNRQIHTFDEFELNKKGHYVSIKGKPLHLRPKEYDLLLYLVENHGVALSRDQILKDVWNYDYDGYHRTVDSHIKRIRKKLGTKNSFIETVRNYGYKFVNPAMDPPYQN